MIKVFRGLLLWATMNILFTNLESLQSSGNSNTIYIRNSRNTHLTVLNGEIIIRQVVWHETFIIPDVFHGYILMLPNFKWMISWRLMNLDYDSKKHRFARCSTQIYWDGFIQSYDLAWRDGKHLFRPKTANLWFLGACFTSSVIDLCYKSILWVTLFGQNEWWELSTYNEMYSDTWLTLHWLNMYYATVMSGYYDEVQEGRFCSQ